MKFDLTNLSDLITDPLSRLRLMKDYTQEVLERILGDEKTPVKKAVVLEVIPPSPNANSNTKGSNEQYYAIRARIENMHESLPDVVEFIKQKRTNEEINKLIDIAKPIFSLNPINSPDINTTTPKPKVGDIVELVEVEKGIYRFHNKIGTMGFPLAGFVKNEDLNSLLEPAKVDLNSTINNFNNGTEYVPPPEGLSGNVADQVPVYEAIKHAASGGYLRKVEKEDGTVTFVKSGLPCTGYVGIWVFNQLGLIPEKEKQKTMKGWSVMDVELWKRINLSGYKQGFGDTTNIDYIQKRLGGWTKSYTDFASTFPKDSAGPKLTAGRYHIAQKWRKNGSGHIFLIFWDGGDEVRILDSSHAGYHKDKKRKKSYWWGDNWSPITVYKILTLPELK